MGAANGTAPRGGDGGQSLLPKGAEGTSHGRSGASPALRPVSFHSNTAPVELPQEMIASKQEATSLAPIAL